MILGAWQFFALRPVTATVLTVFAVDALTEENEKLVIEALEKLKEEYPSILGRAMYETFLVLSETAELEPVAQTIAKILSEIKSTGTRGASTLVAPDEPFEQVADALLGEVSSERNLGTLVRPNTVRFLGGRMHA